MDKADHRRFIALLFFCNGSKPVNMRNLRKGLTFAESVDKRGERLVSIGAYCLMPNHFHILIKESAPGGVSLFMQKVLTAYTMYFNTKYQRKGRLFESSFKSQHADFDQYLKYLFAYIHLNPLKLLNARWKEEGLFNKHSALSSLRGYDFSSLPDYLSNGRDEEHILNRESFPEYFVETKDAIRDIQDWMNYTEV